jgi:hypothetical protein
LLCLLSINIPAKVGVIKNVSPNAKNPPTGVLIKCMRIADDLGNNQYLFQPFSLAVDQNSNLYVYDSLQAKILKFNHELQFDRAIGREGHGPGEFGGTGKFFPVYISIGMDGALYAHDVHAKKILKFKTDGTFLEQIRYKKMCFWKPTVDQKGNVQFISTKNNNLNISNQHNHPLFSIQVPQHYFDYLYSLPGEEYLKDEQKFRPLEISSFLKNGGEQILYNHRSSSFSIIKNGKIIITKHLWPQLALNNYKQLIENMHKKTKNSYRSMFFKCFPDQDNNNYFYLQYGNNETKNKNLIYKYDRYGNLTKRLHINLETNDPLHRIEVKKNDLYYGINEEEIIIFKEDR